MHTWTPLKIKAASISVSWIVDSELTMPHTPETLLITIIVWVMMMIVVKKAT